MELWRAGLTSRITTSKDYFTVDVSTLSWYWEAQQSTQLA